VKYEIDLDPDVTNTSHAHVVDMVGTGKRVLDVGCATGYLAAALKAQGNRVTGVEIDPEAGELARPHLEQLVIGDLQALDLVAELGAHQFDVIVFADVLEHLTDPLAVLRQAPALLAPDGSVITSIPNVAHGAVRLALLDGRFEYRELGLLDDTHVRFFTRTSVDALHRAAGLLPVERRRTVADPFATEIPLRVDDLPAPAVDRVRADPDATTYQFVFRSVPVDRLRPGDRSSSGDVDAELVAREEEINELRHELARVAEVAPRSAPPTVAVVAAHRGDDPFDDLRREVVGHELRQRLPRWAVRLCDWDSAEGRPGLDGSPVHPFLTSGPHPSTDQVDSAVLTGSWSAPAVREVSSTIAEGGCPVYVAGIAGCPPPELPHARRPAAAVGWSDGARPAAVPDPLLLVGRVVPQPQLAQRASVLRAMEQLPASGDHIAVSIGGGPASALGRTLDLLAKDRGVALAVVADQARDAAGAVAKSLAAESSVATTATDLDPLDVLAAIATASLVVTDRAELAWAAVGLGRPCIGLALGDDGTDGQPGLSVLAGWLGDPDLSVATPAAILPGVALAERRASAEAQLTAVDELDLFLDELASSVAATGARRLTTAWPAHLAEANQHLGVLETVNRGLQHRLRKQQAGFAEVATRALGGGGSSVSSSEHRNMAGRLAWAEAEVERMRAEVAELVHRIEATESTLTMRTLAPARRLYGRLRKQ
jgi:2-polyprenyl-3-methyl-5-hydroxy-6-metoxy-1,4-benzoquinol methylase